MPECGKHCGSLRVTHGSAVCLSDRHRNGRSGARAIPATREALQSQVLRLLAKWPLHFVLPPSLSFDAWAITPRRTGSFGHTRHSFQGDYKPAEVYGTATPPK
jgi:hypothetical protein